MFESTSWRMVIVAIKKVSELVPLLVHVCIEFFISYDDVFNFPLVRNDICLKKILTAFLEGNIFRFFPFVLTIKIKEQGLIYVFLHHNHKLNSSFLEDLSK